MQDLASLRRDKLTAIISKAHGKLQAVLVSEGIAPAVARAIAAVRVYQLLPLSIRQKMTTAETSIATRMATLFKGVSTATIEGLETIEEE